MLWGGLLPPDGPCTCPNVLQKPQLGPHPLLTAEHHSVQTLSAPQEAADTATASPDHQDSGKQCRPSQGAESWEEHGPTLTGNGQTSCQTPPDSSPSES